MAGTTFRPGNGVPGHCCGLWKYVTKKGVPPERVNDAMEVNDSIMRDSLETAEKLNFDVTSAASLCASLWLLSLAALCPFTVPQ